MFSDKLLHFISYNCAMWFLTLVTSIIIMGLYLIQPIRTDFYFYPNNECLLTKDITNMSISAVNSHCYRNATFNYDIFNSNCMLTEICLSSQMTLDKFMSCISIQSNQSIMVFNNKIINYSDNYCKYKSNEIKISKDCSLLEFCNIKGGKFLEHRIN